MDDWSLGATRDQMAINGDWVAVNEPLIEGVAVREVKNVLTGYGHLTEVFRRDWDLDDGVVDQVFQSVLAPGAVSAWHAHEHTRDRLFVTSGHLLVVLYDARPDSPTRGTVMARHAGHLRPSLITVPPKVWHGIKNVGTHSATVLNLVDAAYDYAAPDHWRLPPTSDQVPFTL